MHKSTIVDIPTNPLFFVGITDLEYFITSLILPNFNILYNKYKIGTRYAQHFVLLLDLNLLNMPQNTI